MLRALTRGSLALATLAAASRSAPQPGRPRDEEPPPAGVIHAPLSAHRGDEIAAGWSEWRKRQASEVRIANLGSGTTYTVDIQFGTPAQTVTVIVDTGSPNLWVNAQCDTSGQQAECERFAQFDYTTSSTLVDTGYWEVLSYGKGNVTVEYVTDVVTLGALSLDSQIFGVGLESFDIPVGILGLSPPMDGVGEYPLPLDTMVAQNLIGSRAFALDLRGVDSPDGAVIFGGVDTGKYIGSLQKCPVLDPRDSPSGYDRYWITMTSLGVTPPDGESGLLADGTMAVFLDSGGTLTRLPTDLFQALGDAFASYGAQYDANSGYYIVDCGVKDQAGSVDFGFYDKVIRVPFTDFVWSPDGATGCLLGVLADDEEPVLGDSFLRAAYVVYDQDNRNLHLAQAADCGSHLVAISSGEDAVPSATGDCTGTAAVMASGSLRQSAVAATVTTDLGAIASAIGPGPEATGGTTSTGTFCLTCAGGSKTSAAGPTQTVRSGAAAERQGSRGALIGALAVAAWLV